VSGAFWLLFAVFSMTMGPVLLRAPKRPWGFGSAGCERDFHRIGQRWLAHRGESWRPVREAPPLPVAR